MYKIAILCTLSHGENTLAKFNWSKLPSENSIPLNDKLQYFPFRLTGARIQYKQGHSSQCLLAKLLPVLFYIRYVISKLLEGSSLLLKEKIILLTILALYHHIVITCFYRSVHSGIYVCILSCFLRHPIVVCMFGVPEILM